jgi:hypothetical protein
MEEGLKNTPVDGNYLRLNLSKRGRCDEGLRLAYSNFRASVRVPTAVAASLQSPFNGVTGVMSLLHQTHPAGMLLDHCLHVTMTSPGNVPSPQGRAGRSGVRARPSSCGRCGGVTS